MDLLPRRVSTRPTLAPSRSLAVPSLLQETAVFASPTLPFLISRRCSPFRGQLREGRTLHRRRTIRLRNLRTALTGNTILTIHYVKLKCSSKRLPCGVHLSPPLPHKQGWNCPHLLRKGLLRSRSSSHERHILAIDDHISEKIFLLPDQLRYHIHLWISFTRFLANVYFIYWVCVARHAMSCDDVSTCTQKKPVHRSLHTTRILHVSFRFLELTYSVLSSSYYLFISLFATKCPCAPI